MELQGYESGDIRTGFQKLVFGKIHKARQTSEMHRKQHSFPETDLQSLVNFEGGECHIVRVRFKIRARNTS